MKTRTLVLLMPFLASCGGSGSDARDASVDDAVKPADVLEPSPEVAVDRAWESMDAPEPSYDTLVDAAGLPGSGCRFRDTSGWAVITKVVYSTDPGHECQVVVTFVFIAGLTLDAGSAPFALDGDTTVAASSPPTGGRMLIHPAENPPCSYLESNGIVVGAALPAIRQDEYAGACPTPVYVFPGIENSQYVGP